MRSDIFWCEFPRVYVRARAYGLYQLREKSVVIAKPMTDDLPPI